MIWLTFNKKENVKQETKKATVNETRASIPPQQCHKLITSMPRRIEYIYSKWTYFPEGQQFTKNAFSFFIGLMKYSNLLR